MGYTRNSPRCANCVNYVSTITYGVRNQPECAAGGFRVHVWGKCNHWERRTP